MDRWYKTKLNFLASICHSLCILMFDRLFISSAEQQLQKNPAISQEYKNDEALSCVKGRISRTLGRLALFYLVLGHLGGFTEETPGLE